MRFGDGALSGNGEVINVMTEAPPMVSPQAPTNTKPKRPVRFEVINLAGDIGVPPLSDGYYFWSGRSWIPVPETFNEVSDLIAKMIATEEPKESSFMSMFKRWFTIEPTEPTDAKPEQAMYFHEAKAILTAAFDAENIQVEWDDETLTAHRHGYSDIEIRFRLAKPYDEYLTSVMSLTSIGELLLRHESNSRVHEFRGILLPEFNRSHVEPIVQSIKQDLDHKISMVERHKSEAEAVSGERWLVILKNHYPANLTIEYPLEMYVRHLKERNETPLPSGNTDNDVITIENAVRLDVAEDRGNA